LRGAGGTEPGGAGRGAEEEEEEGGAGRRRGDVRADVRRPPRVPAPQRGARGGRRRLPAPRVGGPAPGPGGVRPGVPPADERAVDAVRLRAALAGAGR
ncbi:hypothetical protein THAOC_27309, partial [Thalassiosira oceanica]